MKQLMLFDDLILPIRCEPVEALELLRELERKGSVIGTDEAGRGALAGPVVSAAVFLTSEQQSELLKLGLKDSKRLSPNKREKIFSAMNDMKVLWRASMGSHEVVDAENVLRASLATMRDSVLRVSRELTKISCVIVDGTYTIPELPLNQWALIRADDVIPCVSAASVAAKVIRDRFMLKMSVKYPEYEFERNKGYPTVRHIERLKQFGMSDIHRRTFCRKFLVN